ncbi:MAG TPA: helix-turn-helix transcriptional regulator [Streptosporangiales bacterium]
MTAAGELGTFLRARRARVRPADVGLPEGVGFRRTPGLRRAELAALAGVSIDYYTRLEQGRETNRSSAVLDALAGALLLDDDAHAHLYALADHAAGRVLRPRHAPDRSRATRRAPAPRDGAALPGVRAQPDQ